MKIHIENYKNINKLDLLTENSKLNFFYGICGSGKSSLVGALTKECKFEDVTVGKNIEDVVISVDGNSPDPNSYQLFDEQTVSNVIIKDSEDGNYYNIFVGNEHEVIQLENKYNETISILLSCLDNIKIYKDNIDKLFSIFGKPGTKGKLTPKSKVNLLSKQISESNVSHKKIIKEKGLDYVNWKIKGMSIDDNFGNHLCPFCYQSINDELYKEIELFKTMTPKDFEVIFKGSDALKDLKIQNPDYYNPESLDTFKLEIEKHKIIQEDLNKIIAFCNFPKFQMYNDVQLNKLEVSELVYDIFPELEGIINEINQNIEELIKLNKEMRGKTKTLVKGNERKLNSILANLGIPYIFKTKILRHSKTASISLCHINDTTMNNMKNNLSYGEKNIVSLLIFLFGASKNTLIIDDPASSYDDFRRKEIFDLLIKYACNRTVLIFSHDQVFLKYALLYKKQHPKENIIGKICSYENYEGKVVISDIKHDQFTKLDNAIIEQIKNVDVYYRKILNARLLLEINKKGNELAYGYLSAILHKKSKTEILDLLNEKGKSEKEILLSIKNKFDIDLPYLVENYIDGFCYDDLKMFEKAIYLREIENERNGKTELYKQLSNVVHLNESLIIGLNPYKHNYFSPYIYNAINGHMHNTALVY